MGKHASVPTFFECVADVNFWICLYLTNIIKYISENTENLFFVLLPVKLRLKWINKLQILVFVAFFESVPTFMEILCTYRLQFLWGYWSLDSKDLSITINYQKQNQKHLKCVQLLWGILGVVRRVCVITQRAHVDWSKYFQILHLWPQKILSQMYCFAKKLFFILEG